MGFTVLTKISNKEYNQQKFFIYKTNQPDGLEVLSNAEADTIANIFKMYPQVFSEVEVLPKDKSEIRLLENFWDEAGNKLDFEVQLVEDDCPGIIQHLQVLDFDITGIDRNETARQINSDEDNG